MSRLEDKVYEPGHLPHENLILLSIAISLKRIADSLEKPEISGLQTITVQLDQPFDDGSGYEHYLDEKGNKVYRRVK